MKKHVLTTLILATSLLPLNACSGTSEKLGLQKKTPDEFAVLKRAPLEMPPDFSLRPPRPGAERPQELNPDQEARKTVFGTPIPTEPAQPSTAAEALLRNSGTIKIDPDIREKVDTETDLLRGRNKTVADRLLGNEPDNASVVDAKAEAQRLKEASEAGESLTGDNSAAK